MKKFATLDRDLLKTVKQGFVSMPAGSADSAGPGPVAGGGMLTQAQAAPMGAAPMDPAMMGGGAPMDPAMMGGDPAAMGAPPMDPAMAGMPPADPNAGAAPADPGAGAPPPDAGAGMPAPSGQIVMSTQDLIQLIQALQSGGGAKPKAKPAGGGEGGGGAGGGSDAKLDQIINLLGGNMTSGAGMPAPQQGAGQPPQQ